MNAARACLVALLMCWASLALAEVAVPPLTGPVVDQTGTLSSGDIAALTQKLKDFETRKGSQIAVLIVPTTAPEEIEQYSIRVAEAWTIGRKKVDDGAILLVAKNDRKLRIEVGYGLEGALTDVTSQRIIDEIIMPKFRSGDFAGGISAGVDRIIGVIDGEPLPAPKRQQDYGSSSNLEGLFPFAIFGIFIVGGILRSIFGRLIGSVATGGVAGVLVWLVVGSIVVSGIVGVVAFMFTMIGLSFASNGRGGAWSGGGYSGGGSYSGSGGSSSDSGSFSGGGGSFGGGGASGSW
jgi:uncharacterized protein